ncbi:MAG TPA: urease subunit alpha, partial [Chitinophaga sp.]
VSQASLDKGIVKGYGLQKMLLPVKGCRTVRKKDLVHNDQTPEITVNPETYEVKVNGKQITCEPVSVLPLAQRYFMF